MDVEQVRLVDEGPAWVEVTVYDRGRDGSLVPLHVVRILDADRLSKLVEGLNHLAPVVEEVLFQPRDSGAFMTLRFHYDDGREQLLKVKTSGRRLVSAVGRPGSWWSTHELMQTLMELSAKRVE